MTPITTQTLENALTAKLMVSFGKTAAEATDGEMMRASALVLRDMMALREVETRQKARQQHARQVHYLSLEFLMGRSLMKNAYNLGLLPQLREALEHLGFKAADIFEIEPDAALGNGGLGRLAACYLDSMTTLEIPATGYSICYELGIFKQKIVEGQQVELPDNWKDLGAAWLMPKPAETQEVRFGGTVREFWDNGHLHIVNEDATVVQAVPCDMEIAGYGTEHVNVLRLWDARSTQPVDMSLFSRGEYLKAAEDEAMAETIAKVLYPEDNHLEGKSLRLKQQYFFVSATLQSIAAKHTELYGTMKNFHEKNVIQINDTHPALVIPELMRILIDDAGMDWDEAWDITTRSVAYTNHTVLSEALERWPQSLVEFLLPRVWQIILEISRRWQKKVEDFYHDPKKTEKMAIVWGGQVRMANLCIAGGMAVNGVSGLHSEILKKDVFRDAYGMEPWKFRNVTNGIDHRRWLSEINPGLDGLIRDLTGGDDYLLHPQALKKLDDYADDASVLERLGAIKRANKAAFAAQNHIEFACSAAVGKNPLKTSELCLVVNELLTRACQDAAAYDGERRLRFTLIPGEDTLRFEVLYSADPPADKPRFSLKGKSLSQVLQWLFDDAPRQDDQFRGLENTAQIVERYSGNLSVSGAPGETILQAAVRF